MPDDRLGQHTTTTRSAAASGLVERLGQTVHDASRLVIDHLALAALEAQRAAGGFARILIAAVVITILIVSTWTAAMVALAVWATDAGMSLPVALLLVGGVNLIAAVAIGFWARSQLPELVFSATLRQLRYDVEKESWADETQSAA